MLAQSVINSMSFYMKDDKGKSIEAINIKMLPRLKQAIIREFEDEREKRVWFIWSNQYNAWWGIKSRGYVTERKKAGRYRYSEALEILRKENSIVEDIPNVTMFRL